MPEFLDHPAAVRAGEELDLGKLEPFLRSHLADRNGPLSVEQFPSGHSNLTYLVRVGNCEMVLRRPPFGSKVKSAHDMAREYRVLSKLHPAYPPAPEVQLYCDNNEVLGAPFFLMKMIRGIIIRRDPPSGLPFPRETTRSLSESFIDNLARLHRLDYSQIGLADLGKPQGYLERQVKGWIERYRGSQTEELPEVDQIAHWMKQNIPAASDAALIHNDYKYDNLVLDPADITKIVGVLDWEMCTIGDPLSDLGTALAYWVDPDDSDELQTMRSGPSNSPGSLTRQKLVERYAQQTGRNVSNMAFYLTFARFKLAVIAQQLYYRYHQGLTKDARFAAMPKWVKALLQASWHSACSS
ncbi:MAG TPA: phosphotransferase family protein [Candidatus Dormibacteraeota bacterium]|nr:phosphotransferase family protein [Candidatus Dormibacteraeota bacterium]